MQTYEIDCVSVCSEISNQAVKNATTTYACSSKFITLVVKASLANILYHRLPLSDDLFTVSKYKNYEYRKPNASRANDVIWQDYSRWIRAFREAFKRKYLETLVLFFIDEQNNTVEENFTFKFRYPEKSDTNTKTSGNLELPTEDLVKNLNALGHYPKLSLKNIKIIVELHYVDGTPTDFQPKEFMVKLLSESFLNQVDESNDVMILGKFFTGHHKFRFLRGTKRQFQHDSSKLIDSDMIDVNEPLSAQSGDRSNKKSKLTQDEENSLSSDEISLLSKTNTVNDKDVSIDLDVTSFSEKLRRSQ